MLLWKQHREGTLTFGKGVSVGQKYVAEWKNNLQNGQRAWIIPDGSKWVVGDESWQRLEHDRIR